MERKTNKIKSITFKHKEFNTEAIKTLIEETNDAIYALQDIKAHLFEEMNAIEEEIKAKKEEFNTLQKICTIEYETIEIEDKVHGECNLLINNPTDARYGYSK